MSSSTVNSKKFSSSDNGLKQCRSMYPRNSVQLSSTFEDSILQSQSWSDGKVKDEMSSFIAEYSYLAKDQKGPSRQNGPRINLQTYQVYPAEYFKENQSNGLNYNRAHIKPKRKKSIVWKDKKPPRLKHNEDHPESHLLRRQSGERKIHYLLPSNNNRLVEDDKHINIKEGASRNQRSRSHSKRRLTHRRKKHIPRSLSRNRSSSPSIKNPIRKRKDKPRVPSPNKLKTRMPIRSTKYPHNRSKRKIRQQPTESQIKYIPLRYGRKNSKRRRVLKPYRVLKTPQMSPSVVTLHPSNRIQEEVIIPYNQYLVDSHISCNCNRCQKRYNKRKPPIQDLTPDTSPSTITFYPNNPLIREELIIPYNAEIFRESRKSCKCHQCMEKLKSVIKMCQKKQRLNKTKLKTHFDSLKCQDLCFGKEVGLRELTMCMNQTETEYESSINFNFNSYCQHFDPKITRYFHSILDQACVM